MAKEKDNQLIQEGDEAVVDEAALSAAPTDDEASLTDAMNANPFKLFFVRNFIKLKNHLETIPMLMTVACLIILTFTQNHHASAVSIMIYDGFNAILLFVDILMSILLVLAYLQVQSRKNTKKKKIVMMSIFFAILAISLVIEFRYIYYFDVQMSLQNNVVQITETANRDLANSRAYMIVHIVMLIVTGVLAIAAPLLQPFAKKIHIKIK